MKEVKLIRLNVNSVLDITESGQVFYTGAKQLEFWPSRSVLFLSGIKFESPNTSDFFLFDVSEKLKRVDLFAPFSIYRFNEQEFELRLSLDSQERVPVIISKSSNSFLGTLIYTVGDSVSVKLV